MNISFKKTFIFAGIIAGFLASFSLIGSAITCLIQTDGFSKAYKDVIFGCNVGHLVLGIIGLLLCITALIFLVRNVRRGHSLLLPSILLAIIAAVISIGGQVITNIFTVYSLKGYEEYIVNFSGEMRSMLEPSLKSSTAKLLTSYGFSYVSPIVLIALSLCALLNIKSKGAVQEPKKSEPKPSQKKDKPICSNVDLSRLKELKELLDSGALTNEEFEELKRKELSK